MAVMLTTSFRFGHFKIALLITCFLYRLSLLKIKFMGFWSNNSYLESYSSHMAQVRFLKV
jgi:hypothetical protein